MPAARATAKKTQTSKSKKETPAKRVKKAGSPKEKQAHTPSKKEMEKLREADQGFVLARQDAVKFLYGRRQAVYNIARTYHLDPEELLQEGYEVLLTCLRDFSPVYEKADGETVSVQFTTFFGSRMDSRGMELRNKNPEYQARQAHTADMTEEERSQFRSDPPLLVQHLDQETAVQEALRGEASAARDELTGDIGLKVARDSFFDHKLSQLVSREKDEKKRAALMHVKVGGVFNFQEMAYHFGVTDSRASQILNELMDAFYVQRLIDRNLKSVAYDFKKLKFNEKRVVRLVQEALTHAGEARVKEILTTFSAPYPEVGKLKAPARQKTLTEQDGEKQADASVPSRLRPYRDVFTGKENGRFPLVSLEMRDVADLLPLELVFRPPQEREKAPAYVQAIFAGEAADYPLVVNEEGVVIDGLRRLQEAEKRGISRVMCMTRQVPDETDMKVLRVALNIRQHKPDKLGLYFAIVALAALGLSQKKIADALGTSRTNVIVYAKVKDKATEALRELFEDGLIQITNASSCVDLPEKTQDRIATFIRTYGPQWGKGTPFNDLFAAAQDGKLAQLEKKVAAKQPASDREEASLSTENLPAATSEVVKSLQKKAEFYRRSLKDAEVWSAQREGIITRQTEELTEAQAEIEALKKELDAAELTRFGDPAAIQEALKELKAFYALTERVGAAGQHAKQAARQVRQLKLTRKQLREVQQHMDELEEKVNALRVELAAKSATI
jgi:ParB-like chromosome segregation protein Spo0J